MIEIHELSLSKDTRQRTSRDLFPQDTKLTCFPFSSQLSPPLLTKLTYSVPLGWDIFSIFDGAATRAVWISLAFMLFARLRTVARLVMESGLFIAPFRYFFVCLFLVSLALFVSLFFRFCFLFFAVVFSILVIWPKRDCADRLTQEGLVSLPTPTHP